MLHGYVHPDFGLLADILRKQIPHKTFGGTALCVYHKGECVVDIWGGTKNAAYEPWEEDTISLSFSTTKGMASVLLHMLVDEGKADYDDPVAKHWPEFGKNGKEAITLRHVLCHEAGLYRIRDMIDDAHEMLDWAHMIEVLENARPAHPPGAAHGYHALTYGWLVGEIIQRIENKSFSAVLKERLADPLDLDGLYCGLPDDALARRADLVTKVTPAGNKPSRRRGSGFDLVRKIIKLVSFGRIDLDHFRAALQPRGVGKVDFNSQEVVQAVIPAANGMFTARSLARVYAALANGGELGGVRLVSAERVKRMNEVQSQGGDRVLMLNMRWRLGFHRLFDWFAPKSRGFGHAGYGGSGAFCDPDRDLALALTLNSGVGTPTGDARIFALLRAALKCADFRDFSQKQR